MWKTFADPGLVPSGRRHERTTATSSLWNEISLPANKWRCHPLYLFLQWREPITFTFQSRIYWLLPFSFNLTLPFDFFVLICMSYLYLGIIYSLIRYICNYFLPFCNITFPFVDHSFGCAEAFQFDIAPLINFCFCFLYFWCRPKKKSLPRPMSGSFSPVFSSRNFTVLGLMFVFNLFWVNFLPDFWFENHSLLAIC